MTFTERIDRLVRHGCRVVVTADELYPPHTTFTAIVQCDDTSWASSAKLPSEALDSATLRACSDLFGGAR